MSLLRPWEAGRPIERQVTARRMNDLQRAIKPVKYAGAGARVSQIGDQQFVVFKKPIGPASAPGFPFQVTIQSAGGGSYQASVFWNSSILKTLILNNTQTITGLADEPTSVGGDGNMNWFPFIYGNDLIWLDITLDGSGNTTAAAVNSYGKGGAWVPSDPPQAYGTGSGPFEYQVTYDSNSNQILTQYLVRIAIFESVTSTNPPYAIYNNQLLNQNLIMEGDVWPGISGPSVMGIVRPKPYAGPYITT